MKEPTNWKPLANGVATPSNEGKFILLENGGKLLLENGGDALLEDTGTSEKEPVLWSEN